MFRAPPAFTSNISLGSRACSAGLEPVWLLDPVQVTDGNPTISTVTPGQTFTQDASTDFWDAWFLISSISRLLLQKWFVLPHVLVHSFISSSRKGAQCRSGGSQYLLL